MIIIFTPQERPTPAASRPLARRATHQTRFTPSRPLPDLRVEEEAVFTDPFGRQDASDR
ncbi:MAG TPA: hypothetical protein VFY20_00635 [Gemmatimonadales bacterium]|nr:hypothetical protein [Gemmatimonadales bacterium]